MTARRHACFLLLAALLASCAFSAGCGSSGSSSADKEKIRQLELEKARLEGQKAEKLAEKRRKQKAEQRRLKRELAKLKKEKAQGGSSSGGTSSAPLSGTTACGGGLSVGSYTSCPFGQAVRDAYLASGRASTFTAHSTVTGLDYQMTCTSGSPHLCTGGNGASVYFP